MRTIRALVWVCATLAALVGLAFGCYHFGLDWSGRPFCHKQIMMAFLTWMDDQGGDINSQTNAFPNANGKGAESLETIREMMGGNMRWASGYRYVPGLRQDDPGDLVLMYLDRPTRWTWHGQPPSILTRNAWIVVPVDFATAGRRHSGPGELSERVSPEEFRSRLTRTLDFVRTNQRPNWQAVVAEHALFLKSLEHVDR
jgi:hypothetical protein